MGPDATTTTAARLRAEREPFVHATGGAIEVFLELCAGEDVAPLSPGDADGGVVVAYLAGP